jgi:hypothetical protein
MPRWTKHGWPMHYPDVRPIGMVGWLPSQQHTKLLSLWDLIKSCMRQYTTQTCSPRPDNRSLINSGGGYHLGALNFRSDHFPSFPSSILHFFLIAPPDLQLYQPFDHFAKLHRTSTDRKGPITSGF